MYGREQVTLIKIEDCRIVARIDELGQRGAKGTLTSTSNGKRCSLAQTASPKGTVARCRFGWKQESTRPSKNDVDEAAATSESRTVDRGLKLKLPFENTVGPTTAANCLVCCFLVVNTKMLLRECLKLP